MYVIINVTYITPKGTETNFSSEEMRAGKALLMAEDLEKTGRMKNVSFMDSYDNTWNVKQLKRYMQGIKTEPHNVTVYFDGGFDLQTKKSGLGCVIYYEQSGKALRLRKNALVEELRTNNEAEYAACHLAVKELEQLGVHHLSVTFTGDSLVVINQLKWEWPCYEQELAKWADRTEAKMENLGITPDYQIVSRKENREADHLASQALKGVEVTSTKQVGDDK